jgi:uncharacterized protein YigE (DUF2233 family)
LKLLFAHNHHAHSSFYLHKFNFLYFFQLLIAKIRIDLSETSYRASRLSAGKNNPLKNSISKHLGYNLKNDDGFTVSRVKMIQQRLFLKSFLISSLLLCSIMGFAQTNKTHWEKLDTGLSYTSLFIDEGNHTFGKIHAFKMDLKHYDLSIIPANHLNRNATTVEKMVKSCDALVGINGGFFSPEREMLGLRVQHGKLLNPLRPISWWYVFSIENNRPILINPNEFTLHPDTSFAIQAGPRLVVNGKVPNSLKTGFDQRSALCITRDKQVILISTQNLAISTKTFGDILSRPENKGGLGCYNALNLDGGSSSQLYAKIHNFELNVPNFNTVTDAVVIKTK